MKTFRGLWGLVLALCLVLPARAQVDEFAVVEATRTPHGVSYLFNDTLYTLVAAEDLLQAFVVLSPRDSIRVDRIYIGDDPFRLEVEARFTPNTDFVMVLSGIRSVFQRQQIHPHVLAFTTAPEPGPHRVSGRAKLCIVTKQPDDRPTPYVIGLARTRPDFSADTLHLDLAIATLLHSDEICVEEDYGIEGVRDGTYWPILFSDHDVDGVLRLDINSDVIVPYRIDFEEPASITVAGDSLAGIDFELRGSAVDDPAELPGVASLQPSYPNPFRSETTLAFHLERPARLRLAVYDLLGRHVATVEEGVFLPGPHTAAWRPQRLPSGFYTVRLEGDGFTLVRPLLLVR